MEITSNKGLPTDNSLLIIVKKQYTKEEAETCVMDDDCVLCLQLHKMTSACTLNCGHQFGRECLAKRNKDTCSLCRTTITEIVEFDAPENQEKFDYNTFIAWAKSSSKTSPFRLATF